MDIGGATYTTKDAYGGGEWMYKGRTLYIGCRWNGMRPVVDLSMNLMAARILGVPGTLLKEKTIH